MNVTNVVYAVFGSSRHTVAEPLHQWDKGQVLKFKNLSGLPEYYAVHFSNERVGGVAKTFIGNSNGVGGWDEYLETGKPVYAWLYLSAGEDDGKTMRSVEIPVIKRPRPVDIEPTPQEQSQIDVIIDALNTGVARAETAATNAETSETNAKTSEDNAKESEVAAKASEEAVEASAVRAESAATSAEASASSASQSATNASASATLSQSWAVGGTGTRQGEDTNNAKYYAESTISAKDAAILAKTQAESARDTAVQAKTSAETAAQTATQKASEASQSAADASYSASSAQTHATTASQAADLAETAKDDAQTAQGLAEDAKDEAVTAKEEAETAQHEAEEAAQSIAQSAQQIETNTQDISDLKSAVSDMYPTDTASGAIASFPDGANDVPVDSLKVDIEPVQDLHGYDNPWPAGGGKNKLPLGTKASETISGVTAKLEDGVITLSGTATANAEFVFPLITSVDLSPSTNKIAFLNSVSNSNVVLYFMRSSTAIHYWQMSPANRVASGWTDTGNEVVDSIMVRVYSGTNASMTVSPMLIATAETSDSYSPYSNICPISGHAKVNVVRCGKNLMAKPFVYRPQPSTLTDCFFIKAGTYTASFSSIGTATSWRFSISMFGVNGEPLKETKYKPNANCNYVESVAAWYLGSDIQIKNFTFNVIEDCYIRVCFGSGNTTSDMVATGAQLELGSTATSYEPYQGETYTIELGDTIYGGTLDVTTGELVVDRAMVDLGSLAWIVPMDNRYYTNSLANIIKKGVDGGLWIQSSMFKTVSSLTTVYESLNSMWLSGAGNVSCSKIASTVEDFKTAATGQQLVYELATPITIQLTPQQVNTLLGTNNIFADTGDTEVTYKADIELYIQKKISAAVAALS